MNPFRYSEPVPAEDLIDRDGERATLHARAEEGNNSRLVAPRRYGKTSLLRSVLHEAEAGGWATVYVDFFGVLTLADVAQRIERAYEEQLRGRLRSWFSGVRKTLHPTFRLGGGPLPVGLDVSVDPQSEAPLLDRLSIPRRLHERLGLRTLVVFDEFQDVLAAQDRADAVIRSEIQHQGQAASYIFAGSHVGMMRALFDDRRRAFYAQAAPVSLPVLTSADVAEFTTVRFAAGNRDPGRTLDLLLAVAAGHPQRAMLLAHELWDATPTGTTATEDTWEQAFSRAMATVRDEFRAIWSALPTGQRRVVSAVADNRTALYATDRSYGGSRGAAITVATRALEDRGDIVADGQTKTGYRVVDPLFARWVAEGRPEA